MIFEDERTSFALGLAFSVVARHRTPTAQPNILPRSPVPGSQLPGGERTGEPAPEPGSATRDYRGARAELAHSPSRIYYRLAHGAS